jgi:hypothetical protein
MSVSVEPGEVVHRWTIDSGIEDVEVGEDASHAGFDALEPRIVSVIVPGHLDDDVRDAAPDQPAAQTSLEGPLGLLDVGVPDDVGGEMTDGALVSGSNCLPAAIDVNTGDGGAILEGMQIEHEVVLEASLHQDVGRLVREASARPAAMEVSVEIDVVERGRALFEHLGEGMGRGNDVEAALEIGLEAVEESMDGKERLGLVAVDAAQDQHSRFALAALEDGDVEFDRSHASNVQRLGLHGVRPAIRPMARRLSSPGRLLPSLLTASGIVNKRSFSLR